MNGNQGNNGYYDPNVNQQFNGQQQYNQPANNRFIKPKNIALCIILSIVTCGIYGWVWLYSLTEDLKAIKGDPNATSGGMVILLTIVTCNIYGWFWLYKQGSTIDELKVRRGLAPDNTAILYIILAIIGLSIVDYALMQDEINKLVS